MRPVADPLGMIDATALGRSVAGMDTLDNSEARIPNRVLASNFRRLWSSAGLPFDQCPTGSKMRGSVLWPIRWNQRPLGASGNPAGRSGSESRHVVSGREPTNVLPLMVSRDQRDHAIPPALTTALDHRGTAGGVSKQPQHLRYRLYENTIIVKADRSEPLAKGPVSFRTVVFGLCWGLLQVMRVFGFVIKPAAFWCSG